MADYLVSNPRSGLKITSQAGFQPVPTKAGIQFLSCHSCGSRNPVFSFCHFRGSGKLVFYGRILFICWIPAFAGMTKGGECIFLDSHFRGNDRVVPAGACAPENGYGDDRPIPAKAGIGLSLHIPDPDLDFCLVLEEFNKF